ncbi:hypothetical protein L5515_011007 [Caenorhabditis briggsae]|uniref:NADP-dependent oxidoreductase domain-containing protein n=1 Tax=Caenorhabditis briggsae TaxID=6238 RepID=A0AAE9D6H3_CAEBR|nr:hypothetical protein L3Y34_003878 [Caenorhabditis briggsae]UMM27946.1 hypothetical protein L5515_011007 [Caenorhabditis briggsae]
MFKLNNGELMPKLALGTYLVRDKELLHAVDKAVEVGYRSFDTAKYYENEGELGEALKILLPKYKLSTEDIFLTTKIFPVENAASGELIKKDIEESLKLLNREYLDLVLVHYPRPFTTDDKDERNKIYRKEAWLALESLKKDGKIRSIGISNYEICHIEEMHEYRTIEPTVNQVEFHPHFQRKELREFCQKNGILFQAFSPFGRGNSALLNDQIMTGIAEKHHTTVSSVILTWIVQSGNGVAVKSKSIERVSENFKSTTLQLTDEEMVKIKELDLSTPYVEDRGWEVV